MNQKPIRIQLTPKQITQTQNWVTQVQNHKRQHNATDHWFDKNQTSDQVALIGKLGEIAAQQIFGGTIDWNIHIHGDNGQDLQLPHHTALVKTNTYQGNPNNVHLIINTLQEAQKADAAILIHLQGDKHNPTNPNNTWEICGIISTTKYIKHHQTQNYGNGTRTYITKKHLTHPNTYKAMYP